MSKGLVRYLANKQITKKDVGLCANGKPSPWRFATRVVTSNKEVHAINKAQIIRFAKACGRPVYYWHCQPTGSDKNVDEEDDIMADLERTVPETVQYFAQGAPCMITKNTYMKHGVANGTAGTMHSLTWGESSYRPNFPRNCKPGQLVRVKQPYSINVELPASLGLSKAEALRVARESGKPVHYWHDEPAASNAKVKPGAVHYFVKGARCKLSQKICSEHGLKHGSVATMISMTYESKRNIRRAPRDTIIGGLNQVAQPTNIKLSLHSSNAKDSKKKIITIRTRLLVPLVTVSTQFTLLKYNHKTRKPGINLQCYSHNVKLMFAITFHKSQGQTLEHVVLHLYKRPGRSLKNITIQGLYVALSRVRLGSRIRVSFDRTTGLDYLTRLRRPKTFDMWVNNYDKVTGLWIREGMVNLRNQSVRSALATLKRTKNLQMVKLAKLVELARVLDVEVSKNAKGTTNKPEYVNALYDEWNKARGIKRAGKRLTNGSSTATKTTTTMTSSMTTTAGSPRKRRNINSHVASSRPKLDRESTPTKRSRIGRKANVKQPSTTGSQAPSGTILGIQRKRRNFGDSFGELINSPKRSRFGNNAFVTPDKIRHTRSRTKAGPPSISKLDFGNETKGLRTSAASIPLALANPHISATGQMLNMVCYINSTLQLLAASNVCRARCTQATGPIAKVLQCIHACDDMSTKTAMDDLLCRLPKNKFPSGEKGCAMEFMTWSVNNLGLREVRSAVTRTVTEQICLTCNASNYTISNNDGFIDGTCEVTVKGNITDNNLAQSYDIRTQQCWLSNCHSMQLRDRPNQVRFREILYYGTVVIFRWGSHDNVVRLQKQMMLQTANRDLTESQRVQYRLRAYTLFFNDNEHYKTFRFANERLYCCDDSRISQVSHDFSQPVGQCVMALYERRMYAHVPFLSAMPALSSNHDQSREWVKVHGDGFCWIYAFLVGITMLCQDDFPNGNSGCGAPSPRAVQLSRLLAPYAFHQDEQFRIPRFVTGRCSVPGTYGGHHHFRRLLARIRPTFRFFVLDATHKWIRYAAFLEGAHPFPVEIMRLFTPALSPYSHIFEHDTRVPQLKLVFSAEDLTSDGNSILCLNTDVVICWATDDHFNALSPGSRADPVVTRFLELLVDEPSRIAELFPLEDSVNKITWDNGLGIVDPPLT